MLVLITFIETKPPNKYEPPSPKNILSRGCVEHLVEKKDWSKDNVRGIKGFCERAFAEWMILSPDERRPLDYGEVGESAYEMYKKRLESHPVDQTLPLPYRLGKRNYPDEITFAVSLREKARMIAGGKGKNNQLVDSLLKQPKGTERKEISREKKK